MWRIYCWLKRFKDKHPALIFLERSPLAELLRNYYSETPKVRELVLPFIGERNCGLDLGCGGVPLTDRVITVDLDPAYGHSTYKPNIYGDARDLKWFTPGSMDFIYSSHLLEDFPPEETDHILYHWLRVIRPGGLLILYLPDQKRLKEFETMGKVLQSPVHQNPQMSMEYMRQKFYEFDLDLICANQIEDDFGFLIIGRKKRESIC